MQRESQTDSPRLAAIRRAAALEDQRLVLLGVGMGHEKGVPKKVPIKVNYPMEPKGKRKKNCSL